MNRRHFLRTTSMAAALPVLARADEAARPRFQFSVKSGMIQDPGAKSWVEKFKLLKEIGYNGVEMDSQYAAPAEECLEAVQKSGLPIQGVVNGNHWSIRLSDPNADIRKEAVKQMGDALRFCKAVGGSTVLLVPGAVRDPQNENAQQVWERSQAGIREVLPLAAELGIIIGVETVWNGFFYNPEGGADQKPDEMIRYIDEIGSPWVGAYLDLSNFRRYANIPQWLRALDRRVVKCDTKDYRLSDHKFVDIGDGDVNWAETRKALADIHYFGWISSEVAGGDRERLADNLARMKKHLLG